MKVCSQIWECTLEIEGLFLKLAVVFEIEFILEIVSVLLSLRVAFPKFTLKIKLNHKIENSLWKCRVYTYIWEFTLKIEIYTLKIMNLPSKV